jgi:hypothetical protein
MAIHPDLPGIEVTVCVDGSPLTEYDTENDEITHDDPAVALRKNTCTVTKYVEVVEGKEFGVTMAVNAPYELDCDAISFRLTVDGVFIRAVPMMKCDYKTSWERTALGPIVKSEEGGMTKAMHFAKINFGECLSLCGAFMKENTIVTDWIGAEKSAREVMENHKGMIDLVGEITIEVHRKSVSGQKAIGTPMADLKPMPEIHEKLLAKDSKTHSIM